MQRQFKREPLTNDEANRLASACNCHEEKLVIWSLLDTGLRLREFTSLTRNNIDWQQHRLIVHGKGGPYGKLSKRRVVPMSDRIRHSMATFALQRGISLHSLQKILGHDHLTTTAIYLNISPEEAIKEYETKW